MVNTVELDRIKQAQSYIERYRAMVDAVKINKENREYLKTYIHDQSYVEKNFNLKSQIIKGISISLAGGIVVFGLMFLLLGKDLALVSTICGGAVFVLLSVFVVALQHFRLTEAIKHQVEVNEGIEEQIQITKDRDEQLLRQKEDYYKGLEKRIDFMSLDYMKNISQLRAYLESGEAQTCEEAVELLERNMLLAEMSSLTSAPEESSDEINVDAAKQRLGNPLELIKKNKKKKKKAKKA